MGKEAKKKKLEEQLAKIKQEEEKERKKSEQSKKKEAKNSKERDEEPSKKKKKKKKGGCCLRTIRNFIIFVLVFNIILAVAGYFVGGHYSKQYLDMSANEILGVLHGLTTSNADKLVSEQERFTQADLDNFYDGLKRQMFLADGFDLQGEMENAMASALEGYLPSDNNSVAPASYKRMEGEEGQEPQDSNDWMDAFSEIIKAENFDLSKIAQFDYDNPSAFVDLKISDKQLAAFLNSVFTSSAVRDMTTEMAGEIMSDAMSALVDVKMKPNVNFNIKRVTFFTQSDDYRVASGDGYITEAGDVLKMRITIAFEFREFVRSLFDSFGKGYGFGAGLLTKELMVTAEVGLNKDCPMRIYINNMDSVKMGNLYKLVRNASKLAGQSMDIEQTIIDMGYNTVNPLVHTINNIIPLDQIKDGELVISPFQMLLNMMLPDMENRPEAKDLFLLLKSILVVNSQSVITNPYKTTYYKPNASAPNGAEVVVLLTEEAFEEALLGGHIRLDEDGNYVFADHMEKFKEILTARYYIDASDFDDLISYMMGGESDSSTDQEADNTQPTHTAEGDEQDESDDDFISQLLDKFSSQNFRDDFNSDKDTDELNQGLQITDFMLAALSDKMLKEIDTSGTPINGDVLSVEQVILKTTESGSTYMTMSLSIKFADLLASVMGSDNLFVKLFEEFVEQGQIPQKAYITMILDITLGDEDYVRSEAYIQLNNLGEHNTITQQDDEYATFKDLLKQENADKVWKLLESFSPDLGMSGIAAQLNDMIMPMIESMDEALGIEFVDSTIELPGFYELIISMMDLKIKNQQNELVSLTAQELRDMLKSLDKGSVLEQEDGNGDREIDYYLWNMPADGNDELNNFFKELEEKYYLDGHPFSHDFSEQNALNWRAEQDLIELGEPYTTDDVNARVAEILDQLAEMGQEEAQALAAQIMTDYKTAMMEASIDKILNDSSEMFQDFDNLRSYHNGEYYGLFDDPVNDLSTLQASLTDQALLALIKTQVKSDDLQGAEILQVAVYDESGEDVLEMVVRTEIGDLLGSNDFAKVFSTDGKPFTLYISSKSYLNDIEDRDGTLAYRTEINLNYISQADFDLLMRFLDAQLDGGNTLADFGDMIGENLYTSLEDLRTVMGFTVDAGEFGVAGGSFNFKNVYDLIIENVGIEVFIDPDGTDQDPNNDGDKRPITDTELHTVLLSMGKGTVLEREDEQTELKGLLDNMPQQGELNQFFLEFEEKYYIKRGTFSYEVDEGKAYEWKAKENLSEGQDASNAPAQDAIDDEVAIIEALPVEERQAIVAEYEQMLNDASIDKILNDSGTLFNDFGDNFRKEKIDDAEGQNWVSDVNWYGLLDDIKTPEQLIVKMSDKALVEIVKSQLSSSDFESAEVKQIKLIEENGSIILELVVRAKLKEAMGDNMGDLEKIMKGDTLEVVYLVSRTNLSVILDEDGTVCVHIPHEESNHGKLRYSTTIAINFKDDSEMGIVNNFIKSMTSSDALNDMAINIGETVYSALSDLEGVIELTYEAGGIKFAPFYQKLAEILDITQLDFYGADYDDGKTDSELAQMQVVFYDSMQGALQKMGTQQSVINELGDDVTVSPSLLNDNTGLVNYTPAPPSTDYTLELADIAFGGFVKNNLNSFNNGSETELSDNMTVEIIQTSVLALSDTTGASSEAKTAIEDYYLANISGRTDDKSHEYNNTGLYANDFIVQTIEITFGSNIGFSDAQGILPNVIYITSIVNLQTDGTILLVSDYSKLEQNMFFLMLNKAGAGDGFTQDEVTQKMGSEVICSNIKNEASGSQPTYRINENWSLSSTDKPLGYIVYDQNSMPNGLSDALFDTAP